MPEAKDQVEGPNPGSGAPEVRHYGEEDPARIVAFSPYAICLTDLKGTLLECNPAHGQLHGFKPAELIGRPCLDLVVPEDRDRAVEGMKRAVQDGEIQHIELTMLTREGGTFAGDLCARLLFDSQDRPSMFVVIIQDITDRKKAMEDLRRIKVLLEQAQALANIGCFNYCPEARELYWSDQLFRIHGLEPGTVPPTDQQHASLMLEGYWERLRSLLHETRVTGRPLETECLIRRTDGQVRTLRVIGQWSRDSKDGLLRLLGTVQDITDLREVEQQLRGTQQRLRSLASELSLTEERQRRQIAGLLHDGACQNLALLKMELQGLCQDMNPSQRGPFDRICDSLTTTMDDLRNLTRDLSPPTLYLAGLEAAIESLLEDQVQAKHGIHYTLEVDPGVLPKADDLRVLLFQCVRELLINVVKHARAGLVRVTIKDRGPYVQVRVSDNGVGFDVQAVEATMSQAGGFGLFSIRERLELIGGRLRIQSRRGRGSRLTLTVPLEARPAGP